MFRTHAPFEPDIDNSQMLIEPQCGGWLFTSNSTLMICQTNGYSGSIYLWDVATAAVLSTLPTSLSVSITLNHDETILVASQTWWDGCQCHIDLWNISDPRNPVHLIQLEGHGSNSGGVLDFTFTPDESRLISIGDSGLTRIWDWRTGQVTAELTSYQGYYGARLYINAAGTRLVTRTAFPRASGGGLITTLRLWNLEVVENVADTEQALLWELQGLDVGYPTFSVEDTLMVVYSDYHVMQLIQMDTGQSLGLLRAESVTPVFSQNDKSIFAIDNLKRIWIWDVQAIIRGGVDQLTLPRVVAMSEVEARYYLPEFSMPASRSSSPNLGFVIGNQSVVRSIAFSPDSQQLMSSGDYEDALVVWDLDTGQPLSSWAHLGGNFVLAPSGEVFANSAYGTGLLIGQMETGETLFQLEPYSEDDRLLVFNADSTLLAAAERPINLPAENEQLIQIWDTHTGILLMTLPTYRNGTNGIAFQPTSAHIITITTDDYASVVDVQTGDEVAAFPHDEAGFYYGLAFSPDGARLALGRGGVEVNVIQIWDVSEFPTRSIQATITLTGSRYEAARQLLFSPDGTLLAAITSDQRVQIWNSSSGALLKTIDYAATCFAFSPDGRWLALGGRDGTVRLWGMP
ncbi:MAG: hypothetical protein U0694_16335 [Anaerolineae bacterium]